MDDRAQYRLSTLARHLQADQPTGIVAEQTKVCPEDSIQISGTPSAFSCLSTLQSTIHCPLRRLSPVTSSTFDLELSER